MPYVHSDIHTDSSHHSQMRLLKIKSLTDEELMESAAQMPLSPWLICPIQQPVRPKLLLAAEPSMVLDTFSPSP